MVGGGDGLSVAKRILRRDPRCGAVRQLGDTYSSNSNTDGPPRAQQNLALSVPYRRASVYVSLPNEGVADQVDRDWRRPCQSESECASSKEKTAEGADGRLS